MIQRILVIGGLFAASLIGSAQAQVKGSGKEAHPAKDAFSYVNPFIGTAKSDAFTRWGNEGGTYPGAVAPWGFMQLSPETREGKGYDYVDTAIAYFSCWGHLSGYPSGSAGRGKVMPVRDGLKARRFYHADEYAEPGYYRVKFRDNGTVVEATASVRAGVFRFSFPEGVEPVIYVGEMPGAMKWSSGEFRQEGNLYRFHPAVKGATVITLTISVSPSGKEDAEERLRVASALFSEVKQQTQTEWRKLLETIAVTDERETPKKIFYTAMYHAMLLPWIVSDADGNYRGHDGKMYKTRGHDEYGTFSFWDTFRSLHPLLTLLFPDRQKDMLLSAMDQFNQTGVLPSGPMTGDHAIPVFVDSWEKGINVANGKEMFAALRSGVADTPYNHDDREAYTRKGYVPLIYPESVTRTVEYAYDDWCLAQFGGLQVGTTDQSPSNLDSLTMSDEELKKLEARGRSYRNLFDPETFFMLPKEDTGFKKRPGTSGYKEGDAWVYSYFAPQHPEDLVNLMGGREAFADRLDRALTTKDIIFDNETVFHVPYLFNYSGRPDLTQRWIHLIRDGRFKATPGGLPGNDDLGSMSSWYIFSALGFYPVCPGKPIYDLGTPLFRSVRVKLANGKELAVRYSGAGQYVRKATFNGRVLSDLSIDHGSVAEGGELVFEMGETASGFGATRTGDAPRFTIKELGLSTAKPTPNEKIWMRYSLHNEGVTGTQIVRLMADEKIVGERHSLADSGSIVLDSVSCRLYSYGKTRLRLEGTPGMSVVEVVRPASAQPSFAVEDLQLVSLLKKGGLQTMSYQIRNIGGVDARYGKEASFTLAPGAVRRITKSWQVIDTGLKTVDVDGVGAKYKVYDRATGSLLLDLRPDSLQDGVRKVKDRSGFENDGTIMGEQQEPIQSGRLHFGKDVYLEVDHAPSLDKMGETITMMVWVFPEARGESLVDIFSKGDNHVLQVADNASLTFFAGGWGRGDCTVPLPADWFGHWHHIAGVCTGGELSVYIDGVLKGKSEASGRVNLSVENKWVLGRNEEFPGQRAFQGYIGEAKVFAEPLDGAEILSIFKQRLR